LEAISCQFLQPQMWQQDNKKPAKLFSQVVNNLILTISFYILFLSLSFSWYQKKRAEKQFERNR
jgi:hypothetical protein